MYRSNAKRVAPAAEKRRNDRVLSPKGRVSKSGHKDISDAKRFAAMNAQMVALNLDINAYGMDTSDAIQNHRTSARPNTSSPFRWTTPPANSDGSQRDQTRTKDRLGAALNSKDINKLEATDKVFRDQLNDLNTIQEWWSKNRKEWGLRRHDFQFIQESIDGLLYQLGGKDNIERSKYADARKQYYLQVEVANSRLEWFVENEDVMKSVVKRFKAIKTAVQEAVDTFKGLKPVQDWDVIFPANFTFEKEYTLPDFRDNSVPWWNRGRDYREIASNIREYLTDSMEVDGRMYDTRRQHFALAHQAESDVKLQAREQGDPQRLQLDIDTAYTSLRRYQDRISDQDVRTANQIRQSIVALERRKRDLERITAENQDYIPVVRGNTKRLSMEIEVLAHERARNRQIREIARRIEAMLIDQNYPIPLDKIREEPALSYIQHFYMICRTHFFHTKNIRTLLDILQNDDIQASDVTTILALIEEHDAKFLAGHQDIITAMDQHMRDRRIWSNPEDIRDNVWYKFEYEYEDMDGVVFNAQELLAARKEELASKPDSEKRMREVALGNGAMALNKAVPAVGTQLCP
jgi:hypothetical protein